MNKTIKTIVGLLVMAFWANLAQAADLMNCIVGNANSSGAGGLDAYLAAFNSTDSNTQMCRDSITFGVDLVYIENQIQLKTVGFSSYDFEFGDEDETTTFVVETEGDEPIIVVENNIKNITIRNIEIDKESTSRGAFIRCDDGVTNLTLDRITVNNHPIRPNEVSNCDTVTIKNFHVDFTQGGGTDEYPDYIFTISNSKTFLLNNDNKTNYNFKGVGKGVIKLKDVTNFRLESLEISYDADNADKSATAIEINGGNAGKLNNEPGGLKTVDINYIQGNGIKLSGIDNAFDMNFSGIALVGGDRNSGTGLTLENVDYLNVTDLVIVNFGGNGVEILGSSFANTFTGYGVAVYSNYGYGYVIGDSASSNWINNTYTTYNTSCGIYLETTADTTYIDGNNLYSNDACGIKAAQGAFVKEMNDSDVTILARGEEKILVDLNLDSFNGLPLKYMELHVILAGGTSDTDQLRLVPAPSRKMKKSKGIGIPHSIRVATLDLGRGAGASEASQMVAGGTSTDAAVFYSATSDSFFLGDSYVDGNPFEICDEDSCLPEEVNGVPVGASFAVIVYDTQERVVGYLNDIHADTDATDNVVNDKVGCYWSDIEQRYYRIYDLTLDTDGDGLIDWTEDEDYDCQHDDGVETNFENSDTDQDGISDGVEMCLSASANASCTETDPLNSDSDGDLLKDGDEDLNADGYIDTAGNSISGETYPTKPNSDTDGWDDYTERRYQTNPHVNDTDGDGENDDTDLCPLVSSKEQECYYNYCIPDDSEISPSVSASGDTESGEVCDDTDDDKICSDVEDTNGNCRWDEGSETNAGLADTDGDGIIDGYEDASHDGVYDASAGETNPLSTDSDGDCVADGAEDINGDGVTQIEDGETDPTLTDTDGDTIGDGEEDFNCDGAVDDGETDPHLADTDGDGMDDATDTCPWNKSAACVVRYCGINGFENIDTDGDGLTDVEEDTNGDCAWTSAERESNPLDSDSDDDGLNDSQEVECFGTNPIAADTDGDGRSDYDEVKNSISQCQAMYNLGDTNPLRAEFGGCSLVTLQQAKGRYLWTELVGIFLISLFMACRKILSEK